MCTGNPVQHHESGTARRNKPGRSQRPRCVFLQRNLAPTMTAGDGVINISGVDFWHAVEFSRNGRFLCTHPRDSLAAFLRALPFGLTFPTLSDLFAIRFPRCFPGSASAFPFPAIPTLSEVLGRIDRASIFRFIGRVASVKSKVLEADRHSLSPSRFDRAPGNCSNLPPRTTRVNGSCGAKETVAAQPGHPHIRRPSGQRRCVQRPRRRPCRRLGPRDRPGRRRRRGRPVPRRCRCRCGPRWADRTG